MINVIESIRNQSRLFNEPPPPKSTRESIAKELTEVAEMIAQMQHDLRRLENRVVLIRSHFEGKDLQP